MVITRIVIEWFTGINCIFLQSHIPVLKLNLCDTNIIQFIPANHSIANVLSPYFIDTRMSAFQGMHLLPAKLLPSKVRLPDRRTAEWSIFASMLCRRHKIVRNLVQYEYKCIMTGFYNLVHIVIKDRGSTLNFWKTPPKIQNSQLDPVFHNNTNNK